MGTLLLFYVLVMDMVDETLWKSREVDIYLIVFFKTILETLFYAL